MKKTHPIADYIDALNAAIDVYQDLLSHEVNDKRDYEIIKWLFNAGSLRDDFEIDQKIDELHKEDEMMKQVIANADPEYRKRQGQAETAPLWAPILLFEVVAVCVSCVIGNGGNNIFASVVAGHIVTFVFFLPFIIPIGVAAGVIGGIAQSKEIDEEYGLVHDEKKDAVITCSAIASMIAMLISYKSSPKQLPSNTEM